MQKLESCTETSSPVSLQAMPQQPPLSSDVLYMNKSNSLSLEIVSFAFFKKQIITFLNNFYQLRERQKSLDELTKKGKKGFV